MTIKAHFDGKVIVPDEPVQLPINQPLRLAVETEVRATQSAGQKMTIAEMLTNGVVGAWKDRPDNRDSTEIARDLRERAQRRGESS